MPRLHRTLLKARRADRAFEERGGYTIIDSSSARSKKTQHGRALLATCGLPKHDMVLLSLAN